MSDRFATGRLNDLYLTSDGTSTGIPCRVRVENQEAFASSYVISTAQALDFTVHSQLGNRGVKGLLFDLILDFCPETLLSSILELLNTALASLTTVRVRVTHLQTFDVQAVPLTQDRKLYTFESRSGGIAKTVRLKFISTGPGA
ncbi:MAG TPA: hypothetical protein VGN95_12410 [Pyrinomonadaceae bacterium]|nr:hypothetical protein [Pyrinomonadaceae bacterium]